MLATLVSASANAVQVFALIAVILFIIAGIIAFMDKTIWATLICRTGISVRRGDLPHVVPCTWYGG
jgi:hypothetical protein